MGRREDLVRQARRSARMALDRGSRSLDRAGTLIRDRMARRGQSDAAPPSVVSVPPARPVDTEAASTSAETDDLAALTKAELYRLAQERDISGRSKLSKDQLVKALQSTAD